MEDVVMDTNLVLFALIVVVGIVVIVLLLRNRVTKVDANASLKDQSGSFSVQASKPQPPQGTPPDSHSVVISGNKNIGKDNAIEVSHADVAVKDNTQIGKNQKIVVEPDTKGKKK
jgi:hypothetical protein